ncbi:hypothetical protein J1N09_02040 [Aureitalea sp. L0-47]|uniref:hypothetical protein n=1 Tax=Aureitalea sp. L0-47 TaxID=2816962 RepID=UPI002238468B|nr:hypothetical protein [Aureitalea sp. L0-47]MCW5518603.1 hypothetical protein [Aureitalea sp. L0-47]
MSIGTYTAASIVISTCMALAILSFAPEEDLKVPSGFSDERRYELLPGKVEFLAGDSIRIGFHETGIESIPSKGKNTDTFLLWVKSSYGSVPVEPQTDSNNSYFQLPSFLCETAGETEVLLVVNNKITDRKMIRILPKEDSAITMESYFGPPSIQAGTADFAMLVTLPTDMYDNMVSDSTMVNIGSTFRRETSIFNIPMKNGYAWKVFPSTTTTGTYFVNASLYGFGAREMESEVHPSKPVDFTISAKREHDYADGNRLVRLSTSVLRDNYGNVISDGTLVTFEIESEQGNISKTSGTTINGVSTAQILHPDHPDTWSVRARISGIAESDSLKLVFTKITESIPINYYKLEDNIVVGPIISYMGQWVSDGTEISLFLNDNLILRKGSKEGIVNFSLSKLGLPSEKLTFEVRALGITETIEVER